MAAVTYEKRDKVAIVTIDRPEARNALSPEVVVLLDRYFTEAADDDDVRVLVLTGEGRGFCTGADTEMLIALAQGKPVPGAVEDEGRRHAMEPIGWFGVEVSQLEKPTIAAINGAAVAKI